MRTIEYEKCARDGAIGGIGAIPGTLCAHFCDVIKMRQQITGERLIGAIRGVYHGGNAAATTVARKGAAAGGGISYFFAGAIPAVQQKVATRSTMFLASSASVQFFEHQLNFDPTSAAFIGSATSGYITGFIASPWEWQKVMMSQRVSSPASGLGVSKLFIEARKVHGTFGGIKCMGKRMHAAGVRNAIFDSTFFGVKHILEDWSQHRSQDGGSESPIIVSTGFAYAIAAITAVTVDYAVDVSVKRTYAICPQDTIPSLGLLRHTIHIVSKEGRRIYRGLGMKSIEFGVSYMITGLMAPEITYLIDGFFVSDDIASGEAGKVS